MERRKGARRPGAARRRLSGPAQVSSSAAPAGRSRIPVAYARRLTCCTAKDNSPSGEIGPIRCAAVASDHHNMLAALQRRKGETLMQLLQRLDAALLRALEDDEFTDEING